MYLQTTVSGIGVEVPELIEAGVLILYADGAPPALAEVSIQHRTAEVSPSVPPVGASVQVAGLATRITAVGDTAWAKVVDIGHVVFNFNGAARAERPGEICMLPCDLDALREALAEGSVITIAD